jgi:hypothetical protein
MPRDVVEALLGQSPMLDGPSMAQQQAMYQEMLRRRAATPFRNFGPPNLMAFPDANMFKPEDVMPRRTMPGLWGENI